MLLWSYLIYVVVAIGLTVWLASTLFKNGALFLADVFDNRQDMAAAVNRLLVVGFYMLNLGWAFLIIKSDQPETGAETIEILAQKLGLLLFSLGVIHFLNLLVFSRIRKGRRNEDLPPIRPTMIQAPNAMPPRPHNAPDNVVWNGQRWVLPSDVPR